VPLGLKPRRSDESPQAPGEAARRTWRAMRWRRARRHPGRAGNFRPPPPVSSWRHV